jgi:hypothetical protein
VARLAQTRRPDRFTARHEPIRAALPSDACSTP